MADTKVKELDFKAPPGLEQVGNAVLSTMENACGVLHLKGVEVNGNIHDPQFSYISAAYAAFSALLTSPKFLATVGVGTVGAGVISGGSSLAVPPLAIAVGAAYLGRKFMGNEQENNCKKRKASQTKKALPKKKEISPADILKNPGNLLKSLF